MSEEVLIVVSLLGGCLMCGGVIAVYRVFVSDCHIEGAHQEGSCLNNN